MYDNIFDNRYEYMIIINNNNNQLINPSFLVK